VVSITDIVDRYGSQRNLAASLGLFILADAFFYHNRLLNYAILTLVMITGPLAVGKTRTHRIVTTALALLMVIIGYWASYSGSEAMLLSAHAVGAAFFFSLIYLISHALLVEQKTVSGETLWAAINVYVLIGMLFAFGYSIVAILEPEAFSGSLLNQDQDLTQTFLYFSFVTMTTLGYGDITPKIQVAATLTYVQALIGQLYVAILIARLVSLYGIKRE
jgi:hypothetical protein